MPMRPMHRCGVRVSLKPGQLVQLDGSQPQSMGLVCDADASSLALWYVVGSFALVLLLAPLFRRPSGGQGRGAPVQPVLAEA